MSTVAERMALDVAEAHARAFAVLIEDACERVCIAGSIRRGASPVGDIELVAVPKLEPELDMFDESTGRKLDMLDQRLSDLEARGTIERRMVNGHGAWGPKYKRLGFQGAPFDLFICDRGRYGLILAIRTGPAEYSRALVTQVGHTTKSGRAGLLPERLRVDGGWLTERRSGRWIATPEEIDFYQTTGIPFLAPKARR